MKNKEVHIEKYDISSFEKEQKPYTMILTDVIQKIPHERIREAFLWIYLESLPSTWVPNKQHLMQHFNISARTYERWMGWLNAVNLIEYRQARGAGGNFGGGLLVVLNGTRFKPGAESSGAVRIGGTVVNKKQPKVIHNLEVDRDAKFGGSVESLTIRSGKGLSEDSPNRQIAEPRFHDAHINTRSVNRKEREKTNIETVSVFSCTESVKTHLTKIIANRKIFVEDDIIDQGVYYAYETNPDKSFDSVNKRLNIFLKKVREGNWLIPQNYKGISSQSIRAQDEQEHEQKLQQYQQEARAKQNIYATLGLIDKPAAPTPQSNPNSPPTAEDFRNYKDCIPGYEWVANWRRQA